MIILGSDISMAYLHELYFQEQRNIYKEGIDSKEPSLHQMVEIIISLRSSDTSM